MSVKIITDSTSDITPEEAKALGIYIVPLTVTFGSDEFVDSAVPSEFVDGKPLGPEEFWSRMEDGVFPQTSQPNAAAFERAYAKAIADGATGIVCVTLSGELSQTVNSARNGAQSLDNPIDVRVIDSRSVSRGLGLLVEYACKMSEAQKDGQEIQARIEALVPDVNIVFTPDTLEYLRKGGRIGAAKALLGSMLSIKPILAVSEGHVVEAGKERVRSKALATVANRVREVNSGEAWILHTGAQDTDKLEANLLARFPGMTFRRSDIGPVVGAHAGPGAAGVAILQTPPSALAID